MMTVSSLRGRRPKQSIVIANREAEGRGGKQSMDRFAGLTAASR
jgi:hypothetical protein